MSAALHDTNSTALDFVTMGLGWDPIRKQRGATRHDADIDLNAAALLFANDVLVDVVYHAQLLSQDGAVRHHGDSTTGEGDGDNEIITADLTRVPAQVTTAFFVVTCYSGQTFEQIQNAFVRLVDAVSGAELARCNLTGGQGETGFVLGKVARSPAGWQFHQIGQGIPANHPGEAVPYLARFLR